MNTPEPSATPRCIVGVKLDSLGDLVLFGPALRALRTECPSARIIVVIRRGYEDLAPRIAPGIEWITTTLNPFADGPNSGSPDLIALRENIGAAKADIFIAATSRRNWLEIALAAASNAPRRITTGTESDEFFSTQLRIALDVDAAGAFTERLPVKVDEPDWRANLHLVDAAVGRAVPRTKPTIDLSADDRQAIASFLSGHQLQPGAYAVCAAAGFANVTLKTWPGERFAAIIRHLREHHGIRTVLVGHESERSHLLTIAGAAKADALVWAGQTGQLTTLGALMVGARLFIGNDTGAMHIASALGVPVVAVFGGGTWPRFVPAGRRGISIVQPLPCFGCGWDCAFGDAPCIGGIPVEPVMAAVDSALTRTEADFSEIRSVEPLSAETRALMAKAAHQYRQSRRDHLARQHKLEELTALDREKDHDIEAKNREISALKATCDEREKTVIRVDGYARALTAQVETLQADRALLEENLRRLPGDATRTAKILADQSVHIRNIEALLKIREQELAELKATIANREAGLHELEQAKHFGRLLAEKEAVIRSLRKACQEREAVIQHLSVTATTPTAKAGKIWTATKAFWKAKAWHPFDAWLFHHVVEEYWMQIGILQQYPARPLRWDERLPGPRLPDASLPQIGIVTPSYGQEKFIERTLRSVIDQHYPKLRYMVQDGGSKDRSMDVVARYADRLHHSESVKDNGQADAIVRGFRHITGALAPADVMAWLNSDDLVGPGVLRFVAEYFVRHPDVDVIYGHRIIINDDDRDVGRWIMPRHHPATLEWIDYVPQETLFWRKRAWDLIGGIDPSFQFALDWDLLARFQQAGCRIVRVPYFLGAFRVHAEQKTSQSIHTVGAEEMRRIRRRFHGDKQDDPDSIEHHARHARFWGAVTARLHEIGIRW